MAEFISTAEAIEALGGPLSQETETPEETPAADSTPPASEETHEETPPETSEGNPEGNTAPEPQPNQQQTQDKAHEAFIRLRQQNSTMSKMLKGVGSLLGLNDADINDEAKLNAALQEKILAQEAAAQKVPVEVLTRLQQLEQRDLEYTALQRQQTAARGFQAVKDKYGLTQDKLNEFASELVQHGMNPLDRDDINIVDQYKTIHFDEIIQAEIARAVAAEQNRAAKAGQSATTPDTRSGVGGGGGEPSKVSSVRDLERFLQENMK